MRSRQKTLKSLLPGEPPATVLENHFPYCLICCWGKRTLNNNSNALRWISCFTGAFCPLLPLKAHSLASLKVLYRTYHNSTVRLCRCMAMGITSWEQQDEKHHPTGSRTHGYGSTGLMQGNLWVENRLQGCRERPLVKPEATKVLRATEVQICALVSWGQSKILQWSKGLHLLLHHFSAYFKGMYAFT